MGEEVSASAKAPLEGMKKVLKGVLSRTSVRFALLASDAKVVSPVACNVADRDAGRVNGLVLGVSTFNLLLGVALAISLPVNELNEPTSVRDISLNDVNAVP